MTGAGSAGVASPAKQRVALWDNARFAAVTLVVVGHAIQRLTPASDTAYVLYLLIYSFHIPAFAIISGFFSKPDPPTRTQLKRVLTDILLPYAIMETIWWLVKSIINGGAEFNPTKPSWTLWFLLALGIFRLVLPYLALLRFPLAWAVLISVGVGLLGNVDSTFSLARALGILPFFVLGYKLREWGVTTRLTDAGTRTLLWIRGSAATVLGAWLVILILNIGFFRDIQLQHWFFFDRGYSELGIDDGWGALGRLGVIALATVLSTCFITLVPLSKTALTAWGAATMYIYLLHSFVLFPLRETGVLGGESSPLLLLTMILLGIGVALALGTPIVQRIFRPLIQPRARWLFASEEDSARSAENR